MLENPSTIPTTESNQPKRDRAEYMRQYRAKRKPALGIVSDPVVIEDHDSDPLLDTWMGKDGPKQSRKRPHELQTSPRAIPTRKCALGMCDTAAEVDNKVLQISSVPFDRPFCLKCYRLIQENNWSNQSWLKALVGEEMQSFNLERKEYRGGLTDNIA